MATRHSFALLVPQLVYAAQGYVLRHAAWLHQQHRLADAYGALAV